MPYSQDHYIEFSLVISNNDPDTCLAILNNILVQAGLSRDSLVIVREKHTSRICAYFQEKKQVLDLKKDIQRLRLKGVSVFCRDLNREDWRDKWKKDFHPFPLTKTLDVVPSWEKKNYLKARRIPIYIKAINAFGTGLHETTHFMSQLIEDSKGCFESFLDIGTGSGILLMVALKNGAKKVYGIDNDKNAVKAAQENLAANRLDAALLKSVDIKNFKTPLKFDLVAANLVTDDLISLKKKILSCVHPQGLLAISGISTGNLIRIKKEFSFKSIRCVKVKKGKEWVAILYKKVK